MGIPRLSESFILKTFREADLFVSFYTCDQRKPRGIARISFSALTVDEGTQWQPYKWFWIKSF
jgi:hypothetical protein